MGRPSSRKRRMKPAGAASASAPGAGAPPGPFRHGLRATAWSTITLSCSSSQPFASTCWRHGSEHCQCCRWVALSQMDPGLAQRELRVPEPDGLPLPDSPGAARSALARQQPQACDTRSAAGARTLRRDREKRPRRTHLPGPRKRRARNTSYATKDSTLSNCRDRWRHCCPCCSAASRSFHS